MTGGRKFHFLGQDVTWLAKACPWCPCWVPPEWCATFMCTACKGSCGAYQENTTCFKHMVSLFSSNTAGLTELLVLGYGESACSASSPFMQVV